MKTVWRVGCSWAKGGGSQNGIYDIFFKLGIIFSGDTNRKTSQEYYRDVKAGDYFSLTTGAKVVGVGIIRSNPATLKELGFSWADRNLFSSDIYKDFQIDEIDFDSTYGCRATIYDVSTEGIEYGYSRNPGNVCRDNSLNDEIIRIVNLMEKKMEKEASINLKDNSFCSLEDAGATVATVSQIYRSLSIIAGMTLESIEREDLLIFPPHFSTSNLGFIHSENRKARNGIEIYNGYICFPDFYRRDNSDEAFSYNCVLDAKYQHLEDGFKRDGLHQLITYMHILPAKTGALIYPASNIDKEARSLLKKPGFHQYSPNENLRGLGGSACLLSFPVPSVESCDGDINEFSHRMQAIEKTFLERINELLRDSNSA